MDDYESLSHPTWTCNYRVVFIRSRADSERQRQNISIFGGAESRSSLRRPASRLTAKPCPAISPRAAGSVFAGCAWGADRSPDQERP